MPANITPKFKLELAKLEQNALIEFFEVDLRKLKDKDGMSGELYRFFNGTNELNQPIIWQGHSFTPYAVQMTGVELSGQGPSNRPSMTLANLSGFITGLVERFDQCLGAVVRRYRVYAQYLDAVNFKGGNPEADPNQAQISFFIIEQLVSLKKDVAKFTLALPTETDNAFINPRTVLVTCPWLYRSTECGYTGGAVADEKDQPTTDKKRDKCSGLISGCKLRNNVRNYGGFSSVDKLA